LTISFLRVLTVSNIVCFNCFFMFPLRSHVLNIILRTFSIPTHTSSATLNHMYVCIMYVCIPLILSTLHHPEVTLQTIMWVVIDSSL
jgi:hypothetical protein